MNKVKSVFSIKDLENLSGIKAHTIRIWEKRYHLLSPNRTDTNIRFYSLQSLQKLLNITLLYNNGVKISKISKFTEDELIEECRNLINSNAEKNLFINDMKVSMLNFDQTLFERAYQDLLTVIDFKEIYVNYFIPFLNELGMLWTTDAITPAHEHFITALIKQKIMIQTEKLQGNSVTNPNIRFVLFLPGDEIHDIGLSFTNYEILRRGFQSVYLGQSIPIDSIRSFTGYTEKIIYLTYFTVEPPTDKIPEYFDEFQRDVLDSGNCELWVLGRKIDEIRDIELPANIKLLHVPDLIEKLDNFQSVAV
jgi:DNA-binding transcriptional MerR regulator